MSGKDRRNKCVSSRLRNIGRVSEDVLMAARRASGGRESKISLNMQEDEAAKG